MLQCLRVFYCLLLELGIHAIVMLIDFLSESEPFLLPSKLFLSLPFDIFRLYLRVLFQLFWSRLRCTSFNHTIE